MWHMARGLEETKEIFDESMFSFAGPASTNDIRNEADTRIYKNTLETYYSRRDLTAL